MRSVGMAVLGLTAILAASAAAADDFADYFPRPQEVAGWAMTYDVAQYPGDKLYDMIDGAGEIFMQYNFETAASAEYGGPNDASIAVEVYRMRTAEDAYGIYAYNKPSGSTAVDLPQEAFVSGVTGGLWKNVHYVKVYALEDKEGAAGAVKDFLGVISQRIPGEGTLPDIFRVLDVEGWVKGTTKFLHTDLALKNLHFVSEENVLNLGKDTSMAFADYSLRGRDFKAFVVIYPSEGAAVKASAKLAVYLGAHPDAEATWFKQTGRVIVGTWAGVKVSETLDSQDMIYDTMESILAKVKIYQFHK